MSSLFKKIITSFILLSFIMIVLFSFAVMMHGPGERMSGNCPFSAMGVSLCPQNIVAMIFYHISAYQSFINVSVNFGVAALASFLLAAGAVLAASISPSLFRLLAPLGILYDSPPDASRERKKTRWLALHENSPAVF